MSRTIRTIKRFNERESCKEPNVEYLYGYCHGYGWGALKLAVTSSDYKEIDFDPEFESKADLKRFLISNRRSIMSLPEMSIFRYIFLASSGIRLYLLGYLD
jgi:hypothetical protein